jgi:hypothetical protein
MDAGIKKLIEERREVINKYYDLSADAWHKVEALFARMEQFGKECRNQAEFEKKFATQTMDREYNLMLLEFSAYIKTDINSQELIR